MLGVLITSPDERTLNVIDPTEFAPAPLASGLPTVRKLDAWTGGLQDGNASGAPWVLFGVPHHRGERA